MSLNNPLEPDPFLSETGFDIDEYEPGHVDEEATAFAFEDADDELGIEEERAGE